MASLPTVPAQEVSCGFLPAHTGVLQPLLTGVTLYPVNGPCPACVWVPEPTGGAESVILKVPALLVSCCWWVWVLASQVLLWDTLLLLVFAWVTGSDGSLC